jgi:hypothetical protein
MGIVSPCSTCKNQNSSTAADTPACPRRNYQQQLTQIQTDGGDPSAIQHLALYGTEGTACEGDGSFRNPAYWNDGNSILIWVALLEDNLGVFDKTGARICPDLLNPGFDSTYIQCRTLPVVPREHEAAYFQGGALAESDQLEVTFSENQQMSADGSGFPILIGGFGKKVNFVFNHPRTPVKKDLCPAGV